MLSLGDVALLAGLVAAAEQEHYAVAALCVVDPVAGSLGQPKFQDPQADRLHVPGVAVGEAIDPGQDSHPGVSVLQLAQPAVKVIGSEDFDHASTIVDRRCLVQGVLERAELGMSVRSGRPLVLSSISGTATDPQEEDECDGAAAIPVTLQLSEGYGPR